MSTTIFQIHDSKCAFCNCELDNIAIMEGCKSPDNKLPYMTNGARPHAVQQVISRPDNTPQTDNTFEGMK